MRLIVLYFKDGSTGYAHGCQQDKTGFPDIAEEGERLAVHLF
jgi:hypothetical protein